MIGVKIGVVGVKISNPWVLDYGFGWRWRWRWLGLVGEGWVFLGFSGFGRGGDRWSGWLFLLERVGFFWVWSGWVEIGGRSGHFCWRRLGFSGWVEIDGRGGHFCWRRLRFSGFDRGGDWWLFL